MNNQKNDSQSMAITIAKIKKQSKNLLKLSNKNNNSLNIETLSQAQELLSQIYGYPSWHAIQKQEHKLLEIKPTEPLLKEKMSKITLESKSGIHYLEDDVYFKSYFQITTLSNDNDEIAKEIEKMNSLLSFHLNIDIHDICIYGENIVKEKGSSFNYNLISSEQKIMTTNPILKKLLKTQSTISPCSESNLTNLNIFMEVTTLKDYWSNHKDLISLISKSFNSKNMNLDIVKKISEKKLNKIKSFEDTLNYGNKLNENLLWDSLDSIEYLKKMTYKWTYLLNFIQKNNMIVDFKFFPKDGTVKCNFKEDFSTSVIVKGFINSIIKTRSFNNEPLNFRYINENPIVLNNKVNCPSLLDNKLYENNFQVDYSFKAKVSLIVGRPGYGKSTLINTFALSSSIKDNIEEIPKTLIMGLSESSYSYITILKNIYASKDFDESILITNLDKHSFINIFDLPLGVKKYTKSHKDIIVQALLVLFSKSMIENYIKKDDAENFLREILNDDFLNQIKYRESSAKFSNWSFVDYLFKKGSYDDAIIEQRNAVPNLSDLLIYMDNSNKEIGEKLANILRKKMKEMPALKGKTNIDIQNKKIVFFNFDKIWGIEQCFANYMYMSGFLLSSNYLLGLKDGYSNIKSNETIVNFTKVNDLETSYDYYHQVTFDKKNEKMILLDDSQRFDNNVSMCVLNTIKGKNEKISCYVTSQDIKSVKNYVTSTTDFWINAKLNPSIDDLNILNVVGISKRDFTSVDEHLSWLVKSNNDLQSNTDIVKFEISQYLNIALSSLNIDVFVRNELLKEISYAEYLDKVFNYLVEKKQTSLSMVFNHLKESLDNRVSNQDILETILKEII